MPLLTIVACSHEETRDRLASVTDAIRVYCRDCTQCGTTIGVVRTIRISGRIYPLVQNDARVVI